MNNLAQVNQYIANLVVLNTKLHNLHFNVEGRRFVPAHEYLETVYDKFFEYYDEVAELVKIQGAFPEVRLSEYLKIASVEELDSKPFGVLEAFKIVEADLKSMKELALAIRKAAAEEDNFALANMMEDHLEYYSKQLWFLRASLVDCGH